MLCFKEENDGVEVIPETSRIACSITKDGARVIFGTSDFKMVMRTTQIARYE